MIDYFFSLNLFVNFILTTLAIVWLIVPFILFAIKDRLDHQNLILTEMFKQLGGQIIKEGRNLRYVSEVAKEKQPE